MSLESGGDTLIFVTRLRGAPIFVPQFRGVLRFFSLVTYKLNLKKSQNRLNTI